jgi:hypothetical protein
LHALFIVDLFLFLIHTSGRGCHDDRLRRAGRRAVRHLLFDGRTLLLEKLLKCSRDWTVNELRRIGS